MERNTVVISEKRGRARDFSNVAGDRRPRKRVRDQAQIAARLCGIICLLDSEAEQMRFQTRPIWAPQYVAPSNVFLALL